MTEIATGREFTPFHGQFIQPLIGGFLPFCALVALRRLKLNDEQAICR